ncbi:MAG TPA: SAM-dependent methyltransferase [Natronosporangium sp.]
MTDSSQPAEAEQAPLPDIDTTVAQSARVWNYWLGGKDNFAVDREMGDQVEAQFPSIVALARASRAFQIRAVRYLAGEAGIRQFLDVGTGLPTANNTHEVAQAVAPESRIVYVESDPMVLAHARVLLISHPLGATAYVDADARDSETILREAQKTLDLSKPVALIMCGLLAHVPTYDDALGVLHRLLDPLPSGSYFMVSDGNNTSQEYVEAINTWNQYANPQYHPRSPEQIAGYFEGLELVPPGVVPINHWHLGDRPADQLPPALPGTVGVGRKP